MRSPLSEVDSVCSLESDFSITPSTGGLGGAGEGSVDDREHRHASVEQVASDERGASVMTTGRSYPPLPLPETQASLGERGHAAQTTEVSSNPAAEATSTTSYFNNTAHSDETTTWQDRVLAILSTLNVIFSGLDRVYKFIISIVYFMKTAFTFMNPTFLPNFRPTRIHFFVLVPSSILILAILQSHQLDTAWPTFLHTQPQHQQAMQPSVDFAGLVDVQRNQLTQILEADLGTSLLSTHITRAEMATTDLAIMVRFGTNLRPEFQSLLMLELKNYGIKARGTARGLKKWSSHVGGSIDK